MAAHRSSSLAYLVAFPLLLVPFALYNMVAFLLNMELSTRMFSIPLLSGAQMEIRVGDILVLVAVLLLYVEILKATRMSSKAIMDHVLSLILFMAMFIEFITVQKAATATFLVLLSLSFIDVIGGFTVTIRTAQRQIEVEGVENHPGL